MMLFGYSCLILAVLGDLATPYLLGRFYPNFDQTRTLISALGEPGSPTHLVFNIWSVVTGTLFLLAIPALYRTFAETSPFWAKVIALGVAAFGIGDCIITGLFSIDSSGSVHPIITFIHDAGSGIGFVGLLLIPLAFAAVAYQQQRIGEVCLFLVLFCISALFSLLFAWPRIPVLNQFQLPYRGLWQRISLVFLYLPLLVVAVEQLRQRLR